MVRLNYRSRTNNFSLKFRASHRGWGIAPKTVIPINHAPRPFPANEAVIPVVVKTSPYTSNELFSISLLVRFLWVLLGCLLEVGSSPSHTYFESKIYRLGVQPSKNIASISLKVLLVPTSLGPAVSSRCSLDSQDRVSKGKCEKETICLD